MKSRSGTGIFLAKYSHTASTLYFSWADTGIIGAPSAIVPTIYIIISYTAMQYTSISTSKKSRYLELEFFIEFHN